jgi:Zn-finger nucleic acid-binding protein
MILACSQCSRQYRVDKYPPGQRLRCLCGHGMTVPEARPHAAKMMHCADCGGPLAPGAEQCEYCGGTVDPNQSHYTLMCPKCYARLPETARFCIECAQAIRPQEVVERAPSARLCPRDSEALQTRVVDALEFEECPQCLGLWLPDEAFRHICAEKVQEFERSPLPLMQRPPMRVEPVSYLKCPVCGETMNRSNFGRSSGVIIDRCRKHGIWLDDTELERIAQFIASGGLARARRTEAEELEHRARQAEVRSEAPGSIWTRRVPASGGLFGALTLYWGD